MKRKAGLRVLVLAVPLVGLALVWRAGQWWSGQRNLQVGGCAAVLQEYVEREIPEHLTFQPSRVYVSIDKHDPPPSFFRMISVSGVEVLPASVAPRTAWGPAASGTDAIVRMTCYEFPSETPKIVAGMEIGGSSTYNLQFQVWRWKATFAGS